MHDAQDPAGGGTVPLCAHEEPPPQPRDASPGAEGARGGGPVRSLRFIGNATLLVRYGDLTVLTDPNFLHRGQLAYLGHGLLSRRLTDPALRVEELPPLDAVVLSHLHGDHWDRVARRGIDSSTPVVTTPHAARRLQVLHGMRRAAGLATWEHYDLTKAGASLRITSLPGRHAAGLARHLLPPVMGSLLELTLAGGARPFRLYLSGDTVMFEGLAQIPLRERDIDLAVLHLGGTMLLRSLTVTMDARQGADALELVNPRRALPVHFDDYPLFKSPLSAFRAEVERRGTAGKVVFVPPGGTIQLD